MQMRSTHPDLGGGLPNQRRGAQQPERYGRPAAGWHAVPWHRLQSRQRQHHVYYCWPFLPLLLLLLLLCFLFT